MHRSQMSEQACVLEFWDGNLHDYGKHMYTVMQVLLCEDR
jgi:hypothetical protein